MQRRKFLSLGALALIASLPGAISLRALDYRKEKPDAWTTKNVYDGKNPTEKGVDAALKALYGDVKYENSGVDLKLPKVANNGGAVPVKFSTDIAAKSVAVFQDVNPECTVAVYSVPDGAIVDYMLKIKMKQSGAVTVVVEGKDGKFYKASKSLEVALGGCEG